MRGIGISIYSYNGAEEMTLTSTEFRFTSIWAIELNDMGNI